MVTRDRYHQSVRSGRSVRLPLQIGTSSLNFDRVDEHRYSYCELYHFEFGVNRLEVRSLMPLGDGVREFHYRPDVAKFVPTRATRRLLLEDKRRRDEILRRHEAPAWP